MQVEAFFESELEDAADELVGVDGVSGETDCAYGVWDVEGLLGGGCRVNNSVVGGS